MKLRIYGNSIRLRLSQSEVAQLSRGESLTQRTALRPIPLVCRLNARRDQERLETHFDGGTLDINVGLATLQSWARSNDVSIDGLTDEDGGEPVRVLIEKDFECLHGDGENQPDCFPNPLAETK